MVLINISTTLDLLGCFAEAPRTNGQAAICFLKYLNCYLNGQFSQRTVGFPPLIKDSERQQIKEHLIRGK